MILAWCVHAYTASGLLCAVAITLLLLQPERTTDTYRYCFAWMLLATFIDATDGTLARAVRIKETLPGFDGRRLDDLVDFLLYTCLPLLLLERAAVLPTWGTWVLALALLASAYGFSQADIKSADGVFIGFPSYWNIVAYCCITVPIRDGWAVAFVGVFAVLTFVPSAYPYPTQPGRINRLMLLNVAVWGIILVATLCVSWEPEPPRTMIAVSMVNPSIYLLYAWGSSLLRLFRRGANRQTNARPSVQ